MSINRYNYEEFFLLYADGELNPLEVEMVNQFVQFHPDLKEELDILMDCKLVVDLPVSFPKEKLYKQTIWDADNISEMQSNLLLLVDGELEEGFKKKLEKNIEENPVLQHEWNTLQQVKLPVEIIAHPYKKPLYKVRKVPALAWLRWVAAAAIIGVGWFLIDKNTSGNKMAEHVFVAKNNGAGKKEQKTIDITKPSAKEAADLNIDSNEKKDEDKIVAAQKISIGNDQNTNKIAKVKINTATKERPEMNTSMDLAQNSANNDNPIIDDNTNRTLMVSRKVPDNVEDITKVKPAIAKSSPKIGQLPSLAANKPVQNVIESQTDDDDEYVRIAGARVKKQKIRGIFRGVFRGLGRTFSDSKVEPAVALNNE